MIMIWVIWIAVIGFIAWSEGDKTAPFHSFIASNSIASALAGLAIVAVLIVPSLRSSKRAAARRQRQPVERGRR
jgi:hypothetical protein